MKIQNNSQDNNWKTKYSLIYLFEMFVIGNIIIILGPLLPLKAKDGGRQETDYSIVFTLRGIGYVLGSFMVSKIQKKYGSHDIMAVASVIMAIICFINVSEHGIFLNAIQWCFMGFACSFIDVLAQVMITVIHTDKLNMWMQALHFGFGIGAFVSPLLSTMIGANSLIILGILCLITAFLMKKQISPNQKMQQQKTEDQTETKQQLPSNLIKMLSIFFFLDVGFQLSYGGWIPTFCTMTGVTNQQQAGLSASIFWLAMTAGRLIAIPLASKIKVLLQFKVLVIVNVITTAFCLIMMITGNLVVIVYLGSAIVGLGFSAIYPLIMSIPGAFNYHLSAHNAATFTVSGTSGQVVLPVIVGYLISIFGPKFLFILFFGLAVGMFLIYFPIVKYQPKQKSLNNSLQMSLL